MMNALLVNKPTSGYVYTSVHTDIAAKYCVGSLGANIRLKFPTG